MAIPVIMPKFEMSQESGTVMRWLKRPGEAVRRGEPLLEVETDKVTMDVEAPADGVLGEVLAAEGETVPVAAVIALVEEMTDHGPQTTVEKTRLTPVARRVAKTAGIDPADIAAGNGAKVTRLDVERYVAARAQAGPRPYATPAARRLAGEHGVALGQVNGSGPDGRVQRADVEALAGQAPAPASLVEPSLGDDLKPLSAMRRTIADRLLRSYQTIPHVTFTVTADMRAAGALRVELGAAHPGAPLSLTAVLVRACAWALQRNPSLNASLEGEAIRYHEAAHIGVAVALDDGLIVPVIHDAGRIGLGEIAARLDDLTRRAHERKLLPGDVAGGTFTISNLGMLGVEQFTALINPPQSAILAVGRVVKKPVVVDTEAGDEIAVRPMMQMTLSADHRIIDGAVAARFLADVVAGLERPSLLLW